MNSGFGEAPAADPAATPADAAPAAPEAQTPGALLAQARLRRGWSVQQAADGLNLDARLIQAMEADHFVELGAPVYAKGYLRKYAALLELAPETILARYQALADTPVEPTPVPNITTTPPPRPKWPKWLAWAILAAVVLALGVAAFKVLWPSVDTRQSVGGADSTAPATDVAVPSELSGSTDAQERVQESAAENGVTPDRMQPAGLPQTPEPAIEPASAAHPAPATATAAGESTMQLRLTFSEPSWVEIYDAAGQRLFYDIGQPGQAHALSGAAPLRVVIGRVSAVTMEVDGRAILVPRRANRDSTRFAIDADGSVR